MSGSGLFAKEVPAVPHLLPGGGGVAGEIVDLRGDLARTLAPLAAITVEEFTNPAASGPALLHAATASTVAVQTLLTADLISGGKTLLAAQARNITFTTAGSTAADAPATALITGTDRHGAVQTETVNLAQTATIAKGVKLFKTITSIVYAAGDGTGATIAVGIGDALPISQPVKTRAGLAALVREIAIGALVTTGTIDATSLSYTPAAGCNGTNDFAIYYEYVPAV